MATDIFAKIGDIKGESVDDKHKDEIDVLSFSWGVSNAGSRGFGSGGGEGKANFSDFNFTHHVDKASPKLFLACASGVHIKDATITVRKAGERPLDYIVIKMNDVLISSSQTGGSSGQDQPTESISMAFAKIEVSYFPQKADGTLDAPISAGWDLLANKKV